MVAGLDADEGALGEANASAIQPWRKRVVSLPLALRKARPRRERAGQHIDHPQERFESRARLCPTAVGEAASHDGVVRPLSGGRRCCGR